MPKCKIPHIGHITDVSIEDGIFLVMLDRTDTEPQSVAEIDILKAVQVKLLTQKDSEDLSEGRILHTFDEENGITFCQARWTQEELDAAKEKGRKLFELFNKDQ